MFNQTTAPLVIRDIPTLTMTLDAQYEADDGLRYGLSHSMLSRLRLIHLVIVLLTSAVQPPDFNSAFKWFFHRRRHWGVPMSKLVAEKTVQASESRDNKKHPSTCLLPFVLSLDAITLHRFGPYSFTSFRNCSSSFIDHCAMALIS